MKYGKNQEIKTPRKVVEEGRRGWDTISQVIYSPKKPNFNIFLEAILMKINSRKYKKK